MSEYKATDIETEYKVTRIETEYKVTGIDTNYKVFSIVVEAPYGYRAMRIAERLLGIKIKSGMAMKTIHYKN